MPMSDLYMIVGFEVQPCSIKRTPGKAIESVECGPDAASQPEPQQIDTGVQIVYSYDGAAPHARRLRCMPVALDCHAT